MRDLVIKPSNNLKARLIIAVVVVFTLLAAWFAIRWQVSDLLSYMTKREDPNAVLIADLALRWAPSNPLASRLRAQIGEDAASADKRTPIAIAEDTVRLAPSDYRWRTELARVYAQDEQFERAEAEYKRAINLAPAYAVIRWQYGNFLFRQNRVDEAFAQLKLAASNSRLYRDQVFSLAWDYFGKDPTQLEALVGDDMHGRSQLAYFFASRGRAEDALRNWNLLNDATKAANSQFLKVMAQGVYEQGHFPQALEFEKQLGGDEDVQPEAITNASFERALDGQSGSRFTWQIARNIPKFETAPDSGVKHEGSRSLRVSFRGFNKPELSNIYQTVVVVPSKTYRIRFWLRTENLKSAGPPLLEILNANDGKLIARTQPFPTGSNDWQEITLDFTAPENCNAISIRTIRAFCGEDCPLTGTFWYDGFELQK